MAAKKRKTKKRRTAAQRAATARMIAANKRGGRKTKHRRKNPSRGHSRAATAAYRRGHARTFKTAKPAAAKPRRKRARKAGAGRKAHRRPWNKGKHLTHRKAIPGYKRKASVGKHVRRVNPRRKHHHRRRNPSFSMATLKPFAIAGAVATVGGGVAYVGTKHIEPMVPLSGVVLGLVEIGAGVVLGTLASFLHPAFGAGIGAGIGGPGIGHIADELLGPPPSSAPVAIGGGSGGQTKQLIMNTRTNKPLGAVEDDVSAIDLQMGAVEDVGDADDGDDVGAIDYGAIQDGDMSDEYDASDYDQEEEVA